MVTRGGDEWFFARAEDVVVVGSVKIAKVPGRSAVPSREVWSELGLRKVCPRKGKGRGAARGESGGCEYNNERTTTQ
jgi:hypothetical protein